MLLIFCDGACKGNPGPSSIGTLCISSDKIIYPDANFLTSIPQQVVFQISLLIGIGTNNQAEYRSLIIAMEKLNSIKEQIKTEREVFVFMDSNLVIQQVEGKFKVKNANMRPLFIELTNLINPLRQIFSLHFQHIPREKNQAADYLANLAFA